MKSESDRLLTDGEDSERITVLNQVHEGLQMG